MSPMSCDAEHTAWDYVIKTLCAPAAWQTLRLGKWSVQIVPVSEGSIQNLLYMQRFLDAIYLGL